MNFFDYSSFNCSEILLPYIRCRAEAETIISLSVTFSALNASIRANLILHQHKKVTKDLLSLCPKNKNSLNQALSPLLTSSHNLIIARMQILSENLKYWLNKLKFLKISIKQYAQQNNSLSEELLNLGCLELSQRKKIVANIEFRIVEEISAILSLGLPAENFDFYQLFLQVELTTQLRNMNQNLTTCTNSMMTNTVSVTPNIIHNFPAYLQKYKRDDIGISITSESHQDVNAISLLKQSDETENNNTKEGVQKLENIEQIASILEERNNVNIRLPSNMSDSPSIKRRKVHIKNNGGYDTDTDTEEGGTKCVTDNTSAVAVIHKVNAGDLPDKNRILCQLPEKENDNLNDNNAMESNNNSSNSEPLPPTSLTQPSHDSNGIKQCNTPCDLNSQERQPLPCSVCSLTGSTATATSSSSSSSSDSSSQEIILTPTPMLSAATPFNTIVVDVLPGSCSGSRGFRVSPVDLSSHSTLRDLPNRSIISTIESNVALNSSSSNSSKNNTSNITVAVISENIIEGNPTTAVATTSSEVRNSTAVTSSHQPMLMSRWKSL